MDQIHKVTDNYSPISEDENGLMLDESHLQLSLVHLKQLMDDLSNAKESLIIFNDKNRAKLVENEKLISAERERFNNLELDLKQAQETYSSAGQELSNLQEGVKKIGTQLKLKLKEISDLKKDREDKLRLKSQLDDLDKQLNGKIEENLTMSKHLHTLTIERDHFNKKAKELEHQQKTLELELTASQFSNMGMSPHTLVSNDNTPNRDLNGVVPASGVGNSKSPVVVPVVNRPDHPFVKPPTTFVPSPVIHPQGTVTQPPVISKPVYDLDNPPSDIDIEDIKMLTSMGLGGSNPETLFEVYRKHKGDLSRVVEDLLKIITK